MTTRNTPCWWLDGFTLRAGTLDDLSFLIPQATRPTGIGPEYYVTENDEDGTNLWAIARWMSGWERVVETFATESEAQAELESLHCKQILASEDVEIYLEREPAENFLAELLAEREGA